MSIDTILIFGFGAAGMLGWFFAWRSRGEALGATRKADAAEAGEIAAKTLVIEANGRALTAEAKFTVERSRADSAEAQLAAERQSRQALVNAFAKAGAAVGDVVVESALDRLYPNGDTGNPGARPDSSGDPVGVSGQSAPAAAPPAKP
jgi:hypothetical protein